MPAIAAQGLGRSFRMPGPGVARCLLRARRAASGHWGHIIAPISVAPAPGHAQEWTP